MLNKPKSPAKALDTHKTHADLIDNEAGMKRIPLSLVVFLLVLLVGTGALAIWITLKPAASPKAPKTVGTKVTKEGTFMCLPPKDPSGPNIMSCALGMKTDDGTYYAIHDGTGDYSLVGSIPTGKRIRVTGTLQGAPASSVKSSGIITTTSITTP